MFFPLQTETVTRLAPQDFRMMVSTHGHVDPVMLSEINHRHYSEAETFYGLAEWAGNVQSVVVLQIAFSTLGPFPSCQISCRFAMPGVQKTVSLNVPARAFRSLNTMEMSHIEVYSESEGLRAHITKNYPSGVINFVFQSLKEDLEFHLNLFHAQQGYALNGGKTYYYCNDAGKNFISNQSPLSATQGRRHKADGYILEHFLPIVRYQGHARVDGRILEMPDSTGGLFTHAVQAIKPHYAATRWNVYLLHDHASNSLLHMVQWLTPRWYGSQEIVQGAFMTHGIVQAVCGGAENMATDCGHVLDPVSGYAVPQAITYRWRSVNKMDGFVAESQITLQHLLGRHDILERLPSWLQVIIRRLMTNPFIYQWLEWGSACVNQQGTVQCLNGPVLIECVFLS